MRAQTTCNMTARVLSGALLAAAFAATPMLATACNPCRSRYRAGTMCGACKPCAANPCAVSPCAANPCAADPCAANPCAANPCAADPCAADPCAADPCAAHPCGPCGACAADPCAAAAMRDAVQRPDDYQPFEGDRADLELYGEELFYDDTLSTNGMSCATCHTGLSGYQATFAEPYPHRVAMGANQFGMDEVHLDEMIQICMVAPMAAEPLAWDSKELAALVAFLEVEQQRFEADPCAANPCAANPCAANPCAANPCAANPCAANPCAAAEPAESSGFERALATARPMPACATGHGLQASGTK